MVEIIILAGVKQSGKDTTGEELIKNGFKRIAFADAAREGLAKKLNIPLEYLTNNGSNKEKYRNDLIEFAESKRKINKFYWIEKAISPYLNDNKEFKDGKYVITDFRRLSEVEWYEQLKEQNINVKIFLIERPGAKDNDYLTLQTLATIAREGYIYDKIINNSTKKELNKKIKHQILNIQ